MIRALALLLGCQLIGEILARHRALVRANFLPMAAALSAPREVLVSLAPKSVTAGIAMAVSENLGGMPALSAVLVIATGILGAVIVAPLLIAWLL